MRKKEFTNETINAGRVFDNIEQATAKGRKHKTASPEEIAQRQAEGRTRGKKGCHKVNFTIALNPQNHEYLKLMSKMTGKTAGEFVDYLLQAHRAQNEEVAEELTRLNALIKDNEWKLTGVLPADKEKK